MTKEMIYLDLSASQYSPDNKSIRRIDNFRYTPEGYLINDRGWEALKVYADEESHEYRDSDFEPIKFLHVFKRHNEAEVYYLHEQDGYLKYEWGNGDSTAGLDRVYLASNRHIPSGTDIGTQLIELGNIAVICNGVDEPFKFFGGERVTAFGFMRAPPAPDVYEIDTTFKVDEVFTGEPATAQTLDGDGFYGLSLYDEDGSYNYGWKVSWVTDTGSESPLSDEATITFIISGSDQQGRYVAHMHIPTGPSNVVARRLYRTKKRGFQSTNEGQYYFVKQINDNSSTFCSDFLPDAVLTDYAPGYGGSQQTLIVPIQNFNLGCVWDGRLWLSGGAYENTVIYSEREQPETFSVLNRISSGNPGKIYGLVPFDQYLLIFKEHSIDFIYKLNDGTYAPNTLTNGVGTRATNSIRAISANRLVFLGYDGFYVIAPTNAQAPVINKISTSIDETLTRLNLSCMVRATACYNEIEKEYWCHIPIDGDNVPTLGCVLHQNGSWTFRKAPNGSHSRTMAFEGLAFDGRHTIIAPRAYDSSVADGSSGAIEDGVWHNVGLQVWSAANQWGPVLQDGALDESTYTFEYTTGTREESLIESNWLVIGDGTSRRSIQSIELLTYGTGNHTINLTYAVNHRPVFTSAGSKPLISPEQRMTKYDVTYGTATQRNQGEWGTSIVNDYRPITIRYDIATQEVFSIKIKIETNDLIGIRGIKIMYEDGKGRGL